VLDATVAGESSHSFVTLDEANDYWAKRSGDTSAAWDDADDAVKEAALEVATEMMECNRYHGEKFSDEQALAFPRDYHVNSDEVPYIEPCIKRVQIEQAGSIVLNAGASGADMNSIESLRALGVSSVKVGTTNIAFGANATVKDPRRMDLLEAGFTHQAALLLSKFVSTVGKIEPDAENMRRIGELRRIESDVNANVTVTIL